MMFFQIFRKSRYMQYLAALSATLSITCSALYLTWPSPTLPKLQSDDSPIGIQLTPSEASWVASSFLLGAIPGGPISVLVLSRVGPKTALLVSGIPLFFPWFAIMFANSAVTLCIARVIAGIGGSLAMTTVPIYNGEIADKDIRGKLGATFNMLRISGSLFVLSVGPFVPYSTFAIICCVFPLIFGAVFWFMPESPYYLVKLREEDKARKNINKLLAKNTNIEQLQLQLDEIKYTIQNDMENKSTLRELFTKVEYRKSLIVMTGIKLLQQFNGSNAIEAYMQTIIGVSSSSISPEMSSIIFGVIQIPAVIAAALLVDKVGRRPLLMISAIGCAIALAAEGAYFYLHASAEYLSLVNSISWLPTTGLVLFLIMNSIGLFTLPYVLLGEIFPTNIKTHAVSIFTALGGTLGFLVVKFFEPISTSWGMHTMFWIFTAVCVSGAMFVFFFLPETKGKSFIEIQRELNKTNTV